MTMPSQTSISSAAADRNRVIGSLPEGARAELLAHAAPVRLGYQRTVYDAGDVVRQVYFPVSCVIADVAIMNDGTMVETGLVGREGAVGVTASFGEYGARSWARVLIPGEALAVGAGELRQMFQESEELRGRLLGYYRTRLTHVSRRAVCNTRHRLQERVYTWLLMLRDRATGDDIPLTQEAVARQMGARRAGVNEILDGLQRLGVIEHRRGRIRIRDRARLEAMACVCYPGHRQDYDWAGQRRDEVLN